MSSLEEEIRELQEQNYELVKAAQNWKMVAGEKDKDIFRLTKEVNDLRIQNSILRNKSNACARKLEATLQITSETALSHMVQGSNAVVEMIQHIKNFMIEREKIEISARQSAVDSTPSTEKVQRVPPLMLGGRSIQPVVSLSRTILPHNILTESRQPNENHNSPVRPLPMRVLQELYIPLTRIDADTISPDDMENNQDTSIEDMGLEDHNDDVPEQEDDVATPRDSIRKNLSAVFEESVENVTTNVADPLEGPSRLLDTPNVNGPADQSMHEFTPTLRRRKRLSSPRADPSPIFVPYPRKNLSAVLEKSVENVTTNVADPLEGPSRLLDTPNVNGPADQSMHEFTPTLRRRKRLSSPRADPSPIFVPYPRHKKIDRTLKVVLAKMRLDDYKNNGAGVSPPKKQMMEEAESSTKNNNSSPGTSSSWNSPGPSQNTLCYKPGPSGDQRMSPWDKHGHPQEKSRSPWNKSGPSEDKSTEPWDQPGPSRNKHISPSYKPKGNSSRDNDYLEEVSPQEMRSSQDYQERCSRENRKETNLFSKKLAHRTRVEVPKCQGKSEDSARENSPFSSSNIRMSIDSPAKLVGDIVSRSRDAHFDVYRFSLDSQNNDIERAQIFDAPSPKGSTNARVIVQEAQPTNSEIRCSSRISKHSDRTDNSSELDEDFQETRTRRTRKCVSYKEKPLNRKLRR